MYKCIVSLDLQFKDWDALYKYETGIEGLSSESLEFSGLSFEKGFYIASFTGTIDLEESGFLEKVKEIAETLSKSSDYVKYDLGVLPAENVVNTQEQIAQVRNEIALNSERLEEIEAKAEETHLIMEYLKTIIKNYGIDIDEILSEYRNNLDLDDNDKIEEDRHG